MVREYQHERGAAHATYEVDWKNPGDRAMVDFVMHQYEAGKMRRLIWEREAAQRLAWVRGNQHLFWEDHDQHRHIDQDMHAWAGKSKQEKALHERFPMQVNMLKRFVMSWIGLVIAKPIGWHCFPRTPDPDDKQAAKLATQLLEYYWSSGIAHGMTRLLDAMWHMYATGIIWLNPTWDPQKHYAEHFSEATDQETIAKGDMVFDFATGFELTEPEGCRNVDEAAWIIDSRLETIEWGMERFGEKFKDVNPDSRAQDNHLYTYQMAGLQRGDNLLDGTAPDDRVLVHKIWRPKSATVPKGYYAVVADNQFIHGGPHPYDHGRLPYIALQEQPDYEHFRPGGSTKDLMGLQHARNKDRSNREAHLHKTINPTIVKEELVTIVDGGFEIDAPTIVTVSGTSNILSAGKIKPWVPPQLPPDAYRLDEINRRDMEDIAGIHANTMGRTESSSQSGKHAVAMTQGDVRTNSVTRMINEKALGKGGQQALWLLYQFVDAERTLPIVGPNNVSQVRKFKGSELSKDKRPSGPYEFNVQVKIGVETDMVAVMARIDMLTERGWLNPQKPEDQQLVRKWMGEEVALGTDPREEHRANAQNENEAMLEMTSPIVPSGGDEDDLHIYEHQLFRTMAEYKSRLAVDPTVELRFEEHIQMHWRGAARKAIEPQIIAASERIALLANYPEVARMLQAQQMQQQQGGGQRQQPGRSSSGGNGKNVAATRRPARMR
jgi:hypothetical protein